MLASVLPAALAQQPDRLPLLEDRYPRTFFFRQTESASTGKVAYEPWEAHFSQLQGIMGKVLDEEVPGRSRGLDFFLRFKKAHPDQAVLLHFNGNARDPRWESENFFAGHWLYFNGCKLMADLPPDDNQVTIAVDDPTLFQVGIGRYRNSNEDVGLCELDSSGKPDWSRSEQVQLVAIDPMAKTLTVKRGCYGTRPRAFAAGKAYAAAHTWEGPWGKQSNLLWHYNYATDGPKDTRGRSCADVLVDHLAELFAPTGALASFDGLEFDVLYNTPETPGARQRGADCNADGRADGGMKDHRNTYGAGVVEFCRKLRAKLGPKKLIMADGVFKGDTEQRAFSILNGIESEGWPFLRDWEVRDWSGGLHRHQFWHANAFGPALSYTNHKYITPGPSAGEERQPEVPWNIHRLVFAAGVFTDSAITFLYAPPSRDRRFPEVWDELWAGQEKKLAWLGKPSGPAVHLAAREKNLLDSSLNDLAGRLSSDDAKIEVEGAAIRIQASDPAAAGFSVRLTRVPVRGPDLFMQMAARAAPLERQPREMARLLRLAAVGQQQMLVEDELPPKTGIILRHASESAFDPSTGALVRFMEKVEIAGQSHAAYITHPPYQGGKRGQTFWEKVVEVPAAARLEFFSALTPNGAAKGDGVTYIVQAAEASKSPPAWVELLRLHEKLNQWNLRTVALDHWRGKMVRLRFVVDPGPHDNSVADQAYWGDVRVLTGHDNSTPRPPARFMTWANEKDFTSSFYFDQADGQSVQLQLTVEGAQPIWIAALSAHAHPDAMYRLFEGGIVLANPSPRPFTFDLAKLSPGTRYRRLRGSATQDPRTNDGSAVTTLTLARKDAIFLIRE